MALLQGDDLKMDAEHQHWTPEEIDALLDSYFAGVNMKRLAVKYKRTPKAILVRVGKIIYNERGLLFKYQPTHRISRVGQKFTKREKNFLKAAQEKGFPIKEVAKVLARKEEEIEEFLRKDNRQIVRAFRDISLSLDLLMAAKFLEEKKGIQLLKERDWKRLMREEREAGVDPDDVLSRPIEEFPSYIPSLAKYFWLKCQGKPYELKRQHETGERETV